MMESVIIPLTRGLVALVDACDVDRIAAHRWCAARSGSGWYAISTNYHDPSWPRTLRMHRFLMNAPAGVEVDHINGNGLDNRRSVNLRFATHAQNSANHHGSKCNTSGFKGVSWYKPSGCWRTQIEHKGKGIHLGYFDDVIAAARAYDAKAREMHGPFACCNFVI